FIQHNWQKAILKTVVEKNIGKARRDYAAKTIVIQCPWRMLATGAATEVLTRQQDAGALITREIQREISIQRAPCTALIRFALIEVTQFIKQVFTKTGALDGFQKLLGNNHVGVDIGAIHRRCQAI